MLLRWRIWALLVAALLVIPSAGLARAAALCSMTGQRTLSCCCAAAKAKARKAAKELRALSRVQPADCCESSGDAAPPAVGTPPAPLLDLPGAALLQRLTIQELLLRPHDTQQLWWWRSRGPPGSQPPLFIKHCSLLN